MQRLKELDFLRGFAALNVVLYHYTARFRDIYGHSFSATYDWVYGHYGVELFFVISGFVIFMTLQKVSNVKEFAFKRFVRLYPTYWICLSITLLLSVFLQNTAQQQQVSFFEAATNFTMIQGVFEIKNVDGAYWSLLPELFFYGMMAFIYVIGGLSNVKTIAVIWLMLMITNQMGILPFGAYFLNLKYGMFFLAGILFYELKFKNGALAEHLLILGCLLTGIWVHQTPGNIFVFIGIFALFYLFIYEKLTVFNWKPFLFLGYISYPLYLLHQNIGYYLMNTLKAYIGNEWLIIALTVSFLICLAWMVTEYLEKPIIHYLNNQLVKRPIEKKPHLKQELVPVGE